MRVLKDCHSDLSRIYRERSEESLNDMDFTVLYEVKSRIRK